MSGAARGLEFVTAPVSGWCDPVTGVCQIDAPDEATAAGAGHETADESPAAGTSDGTADRSPAPESD